MLISPKTSLLFVLISTSLTPKGIADVINFETLVSGQNSYLVDVDKDGVYDIRFSTTDAFGFESVGPGLNQKYIEEPGLAGNSFVNPALRVDFLYGALGSIQFGFALNSDVADSAYVARLQLFDSYNSLIAGKEMPGAFTYTSLGRSSFPEGLVTLNFDGTASFGLLTFNSQFGDYVIDNFQGTFGNTEVPEPQKLTFLSSCLAVLICVYRAWFHRKKKRFR